MNARSWSDRLNPVLLKEVRQALRSRMFAILFPACVMLATALALVALVDHSSMAQLGRSVFMPVFGMLQLAALGLVPFTAFQSMAGEWDESTHDLLVLSDLSPTRIVLGKLLTSAIEAALYFSAFLPLLLFTFLLRGVDVRDVLFLVGVLYLASLTMCCCAFALAGLSRLRVWRVILLAALAGLGLAAFVAGSEFAQQFVQRGRGIGSSLDPGEAWAVVSTVVWTGVIAFTFAATRIAHVEDDRSSGPRIAITLTLLGLLGLFTSLTGAGLSADDLDEVAMVITMLASIPAFLFATEPDPLPRRVRQQIPANATLALLSAPLRPGGGRGALLFLLHLALIAAWASVLSAWLGPSPRSGRGWEQGAWCEWACFASYFVVYVVGLSLVLRRLCASPGGRIVARIALPVAAVLSMLLPALMGFVLDIEAWAEMRHGFNPFRLLVDPLGPAQAVAALLAGLTILASLPRFTRAVREVAGASRARRDRAAPAHSPEAWSHGR